MKWPPPWQMHPAGEPQQEHRMVAARFRSKNLVFDSELFNHKASCIRKKKRCSYSKLIKKIRSICFFAICALNIEHKSLSYRMMVPTLKHASFFLLQPLVWDADVSRRDMFVYSKVERTY
jgi:hypothetical protein